eukprot:jgi/Tetstr1/427456/TSEL_001755.t1
MRVAEATPQPETAKNLEEDGPTPLDSPQGCGKAYAALEASAGTVAPWCVSGRTTETGGNAKQRLRRSGSATTRPEAAAPQQPGSKMREAAKLYRAILKEAARFPSTKRAAIIEDIKFEFHKNKVLTSAAEIKNQMRLANESLEQLKNYNNLSGPESSLYLKGPCQQG